MAFCFIHNLIEKIKEAYNRPYVEAERAWEEKRKKENEEYRNKVIARQESDIFIHYCRFCYAYDTILPCSDCGGHMGCGGPIITYKKVSKEAFNAMTDAEKAKVESGIRQEIAEYFAEWAYQYYRKYGKERPKCPVCHSPNHALMVKRTPADKGKNFQCNDCGHRW